MSQSVTVTSVAFWTQTPPSPNTSLGSSKVSPVTVRPSTGPPKKSVATPPGVSTAVKFSTVTSETSSSRKTPEVPPAAASRTVVPETPGLMRMP